VDSPHVKQANKNQAPRKDKSKSVITSRFNQKQSKKGTGTKKSEYITSNCNRSEVKVRKA